MSEPQIQVEDKWDSYVVTGETLEEAALKLLKLRVEQGFWYENWDDIPWKDDAEFIIEAQDGKGAWEFLLQRRDHEYEWVEEAHVL